MSAIALDIPRSRKWTWLAPVVIGLIMSMGLLVSKTKSPGGGGGGGDCPGDEINASTASRTDVNIAIAAASAGDCVIVPPDPSESWSGDVTVSGIWLMGPGKDAGSPTVITAGSVNINSHATSTTRVSGFIFEGADVEADWNRGEAQWFLDDSYFDIDAGSTLVLANGGVFYNFEVVSDAGTGSDVFQVLGPNAHDEWDHDDTFGDEDTDGEINFYMEDGSFLNVRETAPDCDNGARTVIRHVTYTDSSVVGHGTNPNDSGDFGGCRQLEVYDNVFDRVPLAPGNPAEQGMNKWVWMRGGSGVFMDNTMDVVSTSNYPGKPEVKTSVGCPGSYPTQYQFGQTFGTPDATPNKPYIISGNTNTVNVGITGDSVVGCGSPSTYIQSGRDYVTSNTWGYTKFTYPHPNRPD